MFLLTVGFYLSRILSALGVVSFRAAKSYGLLYLFSDTAQKRVVRMALYVQLVLCVGIFIYAGGLTGVVIFAVSLIWLLLYKRKCEKEFGGTTVDTAGCFLSISELLTVIVLGIGG